MHGNCQNRKVSIHVIGNLSGPIWVTFKSCQMWLTFDESDSQSRDHKCYEFWKLPAFVHVAVPLDTTTSSSNSRTLLLPLTWRLPPSPSSSISGSISTLLCGALFSSISMHLWWYILYLFVAVRFCGLASIIQCHSHASRRGGHYITIHLARNMHRQWPCHILLIWLHLK